MLVLHLSSQLMTSSPPPSGGKLVRLSVDESQFSSLVCDLSQNVQTTMDNMFLMATLKLLTLTNLCKPSLRIMKERELQRFCLSEEEYLRTGQRTFAQNRLFSSWHAQRFMEKVSSREARRRRLSDRGSERLALITGRIQSLSPDSNLSQTPFDSWQREDPSHPKDDSVREPCRQYDCVPEVEPLLHNGDKGKSIASASTTLLGKEEPVFQSLPSVRSPAKARQHEHRSPFTPGEIISAISAEDVRTRYAVAAALLVILSYIGFPILGWGVIRAS